MSVAAPLIRLARHRSGLTQRELAARAGTSPAAIAQYENGKRDPAVGTLQRVLRAAGWDLRCRLEPPDLYSESLEKVLRERYTPEERAAWRERTARWAEEARQTPAA